MTTETNVAKSVKPAVLINQYPYYDPAGNKMQRIKLLFICGHTEEFCYLDLGKGWKPASNAMLMREYLRITCPIAWRLCRACCEGAQAS